MRIKRVGVIGCGVMGSGIAQVIAQAGYDTVVRELSEDLLNQGLRRIAGFLNRAVERGKLSEGRKQETLARLHGSTDLQPCADCDLVIEAIIENVAAKQALFKELDQICPAHAVLASNTSSISITALSSATQRPQQVLGLHFFNPVPIMGLVEMVPGLQTSTETITVAQTFVETLGKKVITAKDTPGFIVNYLLIPYLLDAVRMVEAGVATKEDIDTGMEMGCNLPMGPLRLLDFIGVDTTLYIADVMYEGFKDPKYAAPPLLRQMVTAGFRGRKSGKGFYEYV